MRSFAYSRAADVAAAVRDASGNSPAIVPPTDAPVQFLAGGTTLLDLMKLDVMRPVRLVDLDAIRPRADDGIRSGADGLQLSAFASMAETAAHPIVARDYPVIAETLLLAASAQLRNMATLGGNLLQRTRCPYFREPRTTPCNKRVPGSGCSALDGVHRGHAVLGTSDACIAAYPGDFAQALVALDATLDVTSPNGRRSVRVADLHRLPEGTPQVETTLAAGELITSIAVPAGPWTRRSRYVKVRDRASFQFALASAAVALDLRDDTVQVARIALGGVATVPWRAREAESVLAGKRLDEATARAAADAAFAAARPCRDNAFKVELGRRTLVRALLEAAALPA
jgi:xanthine dehydrogenase YagS FAD-binding subunit